MWHN